MAAKEQPTSGKGPMANVDPAQFAKAGKKQVDALVEMQQDLVKGMEEMSREWAARIKVETDLANEFARKLSAAKSAPDSMAVYQEWLSRRMEMFAEDSRRIAADSQKFLAKGARLFSGG
jgi:hypothetical protein